VCTESLVVPVVRVVLGSLPRTRKNQSSYPFTRKKLQLSCPVGRVPESPT
ncbi:Hypothetical predicted protein, partial [Marmota monax]